MREQGSVLRLPRRPLPVALWLGLLAELLFAWRITTPHKLMFDEIHYVPAAQTLRALSGPVNIEHPLLGKIIIALGIALFGDDPWGWRLFSSLAGTAVVTGVFAILWLGLRRLRPAVIGALLTIVNFTVFVQARIAMLDGFMAAFVVDAIAFLLWSMRAHGAWVASRWTIGAMLLGMAAATKWTAVPYAAYAGIAYLVLRWRRPDRWPGLHPALAIGLLGTVGVATYLLTFAPAFFYASDPLTLARLIPFQREMYAQQTQILPPHTYQSAWWTWPLDLRPIWYLYEPVDGAQRGVLMLGNPAVMWGGLLAVLACVGAWVRDRSTAGGAAAALWIAGTGVWAVIPKSLGFFYYYYLPSIWLGIVIAVAFDHWRARLLYWDEAFLLLAAVLFVHFYPILSASALNGPGSFGRWMWLRTWP